MQQIKLSESTAARKRATIYLVDATDGYTPETGVATPTIEISKNGGAQASGTGTFTEIGDGLYYYEFASGEIDTLGTVQLRCVKSGTSREFVDVVQIVAYDPYDATAFGLSRLDAAISSRSTLDAAGVRSAVGLASANLDTQLSDIDNFIDTEVAAILAAVDTEVGSILTGVNTLTTDYTTARAAKLDNLDATISSRSSHDVADVWSSLTRTLTSASNITSDGGTIPISGGFVLANVSGMSANVLTASALASDAVAEIQSGLATTGAAMTLTSGERNAVADAILSRSVATVEGTAGEYTLCTVILASLESSVSGTTWTIKRTDGSTTHATKTISKTTGDDPIRGVS